MTDPAIALPVPAGIRAQVALAPYTTFRVGGAAEWLCEPRTVEELRRYLEWGMEGQQPVTYIGRGSNLLVSDRGLDGLVVSLKHLHGLDWGADGQFWVSAGVSVIKLAHAVAERGWHGLEWAVGIPGSVGGAVVMNAGAHGQSTSSYLVSVDILDERLQRQTVLPEHLGFKYRTSILQQCPWLVLGARFQLEPGHDPARVSAQTQANWEQRRQSQPYDWPSCGSVFRNPQSRAAGWLIEQAGLKGFRIGGAQVACKHANFILNRDRASAADIYRLIRHVQEGVHHRWSLRLHPEVRILGDFSDVAIA